MKCPARVSGAEPRSAVLLGVCKKACSRNDPALGVLRTGGHPLLDLMYVCVGCGGRARSHTHTSVTGMCHSETPTSVVHDGGEDGFEGGPSPVRKGAQVDDSAAILDDSKEHFIGWAWLPLPQRCRLRGCQ